MFVFAKAYLLGFDVSGYCWFAWLTWLLCMCNSVVSFFLVGHVFVFLLFIYL